eukprot:CAMPEP_0116900496 /NCGR_PEP_ID=MMETSP0467-20121206/8752_1 /TAXON_ID=283647 /ORGANISM="Mesodinium pulex, Strain SPMC105" /LENGTH=67 /DNA_ID=CAMNT_0004573749 /DNA_START=343 /DNA_END=546 /DNA_ORIENTATION=-
MQIELHIHDIQDKIEAHDSNIDLYRSEWEHKLDNLKATLIETKHELGVKEGELYYIKRQFDEHEDEV